MRNCLILGSGRSGTSMVAGALSDAGYFMGDSLLPPNESCPKGFFEDAEVNRINEALLAQVVPRRPRIIGDLFFKDRPTKAQRWLARIPPGTVIPVNPELESRMAAMLEREPYCLKDPRFSYTLPVWRPLLKDCVYVCVFRNPAITAESILKDCRSTPYLHNLSIDFDQALEVWMLMYQHILTIHANSGEWLFLHYDQVMSADGLQRLSTFLGAKVDSDFPDSSLRRSSSDREVPSAGMELYARLCEAAKYSQL